MTASNAFALIYIIRDYKFKILKRIRDKKL